MPRFEISHWCPFESSVPSCSRAPSPILSILWAVGRVGTWCRRSWQLRAILRCTDLLSCAPSLKGANVCHAGGVQAGGHAHELRVEVKGGSESSSCCCKKERVRPCKCGARLGYKFEAGMERHDNCNLQCDLRGAFLVLRMWFI
jgi:hypothetical protein